MNKSRRPKGTNKPGHRRGAKPLGKRLKTKEHAEARADKILRRAEEKEAARLTAQAEARRAKKALQKTVRGE